MDEKIKKQQEAEAQAKIDAAVATAKKETEDQIKAKDAEIAGLKSKDTNFSEIRKKLEDAEKEKGELKTKLEEKEKAEAAGKIKEVAVKSIEKIAGKDENLKKLIDFHFEKIGADAKTPEEIEAKVQEALALAKTDRKQGVVRSQEGAGGGRKIVSGGGDADIDPEVQKWGDEFNKRGNAGITADDLKKSAKKFNK